MTDAVFPETSYTTAEALVDAALSGLDRNELVTVPTLRKATQWDGMGTLRGRFLGSVISGKVADRYLSDG